MSCHHGEIKLLAIVAVMGNFEQRAGIKFLND